MKAATAAAKRQPQELDKNQIGALGTLYDAWWQDSAQKILLPAKFEAVAESLVTLRLITRFHKSPYRSTYKITPQGRRRYEEVNPKKAAQTRECWSDSAVSEQILRMLSALGYEAQLDDEDFSVNQEDTTHLLSRREIANLLACPLKHPLSLREHNNSESDMSWYSFPLEQ